MSRFQNVRAYLPQKGIVRADIVYENGVIVSVTETNDASAPSSLPENAVLLPGFIDEHIHGAGGADAMDGSAEAIGTIAKCLAKEGTTTFLATTMTQSRKAIKQALKAIAQAAKTDACEGADVLGVHLEGPFISPKFIGAQPLEYIETPDIALFDEFQSTADQRIRMVSLAPEVEGASELIAHLAANGVRPAVGHSGAGYDEMMAAVDAGLSCVTHTYNAQSPVHHREVGVVGSAMLCDALYTELICDTIHVSVPAIKLLIRNKPADKVILITDSMRAKGLPDGISELGGQTVYVKNGEARLENGALAGSVLRMNDAIRNLVEKVGVPFETAVDFATVNPATHLGLAHERGTIEVGKRADFTVLDDAFNVLQTIVGGKTVFEK